MEAHSPQIEARAPQPFTVDSQTHSVGLRPDGSFGGLWTITATAHGTQFSVQVPDEGYDAPTVGQLLANRAATIASVNALGKTE